MKKIISIMLLIASLVCFGCGKKEDDEGNDNSMTTTTSAQATTTAEQYYDFSEVFECKLTDDAQYDNIVPERQSQDLHIIGEGRGIRLSMPTVIELKFDLILSNVEILGNCTVYANGHTFLVNEDVIGGSDSRFTVFGGGRQKDVFRDTNIILLGAKYNNIYGGGQSGDVYGDTNIIFGGKANLGDSHDDASKNKTPTHVVGGGRHGRVSGYSNITVQGSAVALFVVGAGIGDKGVMMKGTNIKVEGGKIGNLYGGALQDDVPDMDVNITMTGGLVESVFGGSQDKDLGGSVEIRLLGGDVSRRVYTGSYNQSFGGGKKKVKGTTCLIIGKDVKLATRTELSSTNAADMGVFCGSRGVSSTPVGEFNILVFVDGSYSEMYNKIGRPNSVKSRHEQIYVCESGGDVRLSDDGLSLVITPDDGNVGYINSQKFEHGADPSSNLYKIDKQKAGGVVENINVCFYKK